MNIKVQQGNVIMKKRFSDEEVFTAECLGFQVSPDYSTVVAEVDKTARKALFEFLKFSSRAFMQSPSYADQRKVVFGKLKQAYQQSYDTFMEKFKPDQIYAHLGRELYPHQIETLWLYQKKKINLCSFEQGLGKTIFAATMSKVFKIARTIVVGPSLVKWNWVHDLSDDWGYNSMFFTVLDSKKTMYACMHERFVIINYEMLEKFMPYLTSQDCGHIIFDECHKLKNRSTFLHRNSAKLIKAFPDARVTLLTGTPVTNRVVDLFAYLKIAKHPLGKNFTKFKERYARGKRQVVGVKNVEDLRLKISNFVVRKKSEECLDLPELRISRYRFDMDDQYVQEYNQLMEDFCNAQERVEEIDARVKEMVKNMDVTSDEFKQERKRLKEERFEHAGKAKGNIHTMNRLCANSKVPNIIKLTDNLIEQEEKVVIFGGYTETLESLKKHYGDTAVLINGSVSTFERQKRIEAFKKDDKVKVFIAQFIAGGIGINLVNSCKCIFTNLPFTPDWVSQPFKRLHRGGQVRDVDIMITMIPDSVDERIYAMVQGKEDDINEIIDHDKEHKIEYGSLENKMFSELLKHHKKQLVN